jgi:hypothetical protein
MNPAIVYLTKYNLFQSTMDVPVSLFGNLLSPTVQNLTDWLDFRPGNMDSSPWRLTLIPAQAGKSVNKQLW